MIPTQAVLAVPIIFSKEIYWLTRHDPTDLQMKALELIHGPHQLTQLSLEFRHGYHFVEVVEKLSLSAFVYVVAPKGCIRAGMARGLHFARPICTLDRASGLSVPYSFRFYRDGKSVDIVRFQPRLYLPHHHN